MGIIEVREGYCVGVVWIFGVLLDFGGGVVGGIEYFWVGVC